MEKSTSNLVVASSKRGRESDSDDIAHEKKPKIDRVVPLQLVDINEDCLQAIFEYLNVRNLINVAETDDRFIPAACSVFSRYHRKKSVSVCFYDEENANELVIEASTTVIFLRHFGHLISKLSLYHLSIIDPDAAIQLSIFKHCSTSLAELSLNLFEEKDFHAIEQPFTNVKRLSINKCWLNSNLSLLSKWFPDLSSLSLNCVYQLHSQTIAHFPQLKHLKIIDHFNDIDLGTINKMLHCNPQLESLVFERDCNANFLQSITKSLPQLQELELWVPNDRFRSFGKQIVRFESVKKLKLTGRNTRGPDLIENLPFVLIHVEKLIVEP